MSQSVILRLAAITLSAAVCFSGPSALAEVVFYDDTVDGDVGGEFNGEPFSELGTLPNENGVYIIRGSVFGEGEPPSQPPSDDQEAFNFTVPATFNFFGDSPSDGTALEAQALYEGANAGDFGTGANPAFDTGIFNFFPPFTPLFDPEALDLPAGTYSFKGFEGVAFSSVDWEVRIEITGATEGQVIPEPSTLTVCGLGLLSLASRGSRQRR